MKKLLLIFIVFCSCNTKHNTHSSLPEIEKVCLEKYIIRDVAYYQSGKNKKVYITLTRIDGKYTITETINECTFRDWIMNDTLTFKAIYYRGVKVPNINIKSQVCSNY